LGRCTAGLLADFVGFTSLADPRGFTLGLLPTVLRELALLLLLLLALLPSLLLVLLLEAISRSRASAVRDRMFEKRLRRRAQGPSVVVVGGGGVEGMMYTAAAQQYILACNLEVGQIHATLLIWQAPLSMHLRQGHADLPARQCATAVVTGQATSAAGSKHAPSKEALGNIPL
jgi:hypothetical protein